MASVVGGGCVGRAGSLIALQAANNNKIMPAFMTKMFFVFMAELLFFVLILPSGQAVILPRWLSI